MLKTMLAVIFTVLLLPMLSLGQADPNTHFWALEYSDSHGITMHRFLDENWDVFLGGWTYSDDDSEKNENYQYSEIGGFTLSEKFYTERTRTSYQVHLGVGRSLWQEGDFRFSGLLRFRHLWTEFDYLDMVVSPDYPEPAIRHEVGHSSTTSVYFGLRPSYDITSRIALFLEFGVVYQNNKYTQDMLRDDPNDIGWYGNSKSRRATSRDQVNLYGYNSLYSISLMFRF